MHIVLSINLINVPTILPAWIIKDTKYEKIGSKIGIKTTIKTSITTFLFLKWAYIPIC